MNWQESEFKDIVEQFRSLVVKDEPRPTNFCFAVSYPLSILLKFSNFNAVITGGTCKGLSHFWIKNEFNSEQIIDATASQFEGLPEINYKLDDNYKEEKINWLLQFDDWAFPLKNDGLRRPHHIVADERKVMPDFDRIRLANYRAASALLTFLNQNVPAICWQDHQYFDCIGISIDRLLKSEGKEELKAHPDVIDIGRRYGLIAQSGAE